MDKIWPRNSGRDSGKLNGHSVTAVRQSLIPTPIEAVLKSMSELKPTVLVTGANGYTGKHLCQYLARAGVATRAMYWAPDGVPEFSHPNLELVPGDLRDRDSLKRALDGIEVVHNIAALYRPTNVSNAMFWEVNVEGIRNMVELAAEAGVKRFVQCSTVGVYGDVENPPATEETPVKPDDYYQYTKLKGEELARELGQSLNLPVVVVRPAGIYGPLEDRFLKLPRLIKSGRFVMFGDGKALYHFIHIDDLCAAFVLCAEKEAAVGQTYVIADDHPIAIRDVVALMANAQGLPPPRWRLPLFVLIAVSAMVEFACKPFGLSPPLHRRRAHWFYHMRAFDNGKAKRELGFAPKVAPQDGLREMVRSYKEAGWL